MTMKLVRSLMARSITFEKARLVALLTSAENASSLSFRRNLADGPLRWMSAACSNVQAVDNPR